MLLIPRTCDRDGLVNCTKDTCSVNRVFTLLPKGARDDYMLMHATLPSPKSKQVLVIFKERKTRKFISITAPYEARDWTEGFDHE